MNNGKGPRARSQDTGLQGQVLGILAVCPWVSDSLLLSSVFSMQNGKEANGPTKLLGLLGRFNNIENQKLSARDQRSMVALSRIPVL